MTSPANSIPDPNTTKALPLPHLHALVLAGGSGTRFWPLSRELAPKQMLTLFGDGSLVSDTIVRVERFCEGIHVLTSELLFDEMRNHLLSDPRLDADRLEILAEPTPRNTAFAIALAAAHFYRIDPDAIMVVLPSDHLLRDDDEWSRAITTAYRAAVTGSLVTFGIDPTRPETGFGYILPSTTPVGDFASDSQSDSQDDTGNEGDPRIGAWNVERFVEKPDLATAQRYVDEGYLWNSGMFMMKAATVLEEFSRTGLVSATDDAKENVLIRNAAEEIAALDCWTDSAAREIVQPVPSVPFDKAVLEVSDNVAVVPAALDWSDVGSLGALDALREADGKGNRAIGRNVDIDSRNITVYSDDSLIATLGLENIVVVDTPDATLIASKDRAQDVRQVVDALKEQNAEEITRSRHSVRPWGSWTLLVDTPTYKVKRIEVLPGKRLSLQSHEHRSEHWIVVGGQAEVESGDSAASLATRTLKTGESTFLPARMIHRLENKADETLAIIEIAVGTYLGEDDIVRYEDDWAR